MPKRTCKTCGGYVRLYTKYGCFLWREKTHYCRVCGELAYPEGSCKKWRKRVREYEYSLKRLNCAAQDIAALINIFGDK